jgi:ParB/RepB/Spo0J family partition protein
MTKKTPAVSAAAVAEQLAQDGGIYGQYELAKIRISPDNRKRFNEQALQELAASITSVGVAQPILIRPVDPTPDAPEEFEIVAGERRYRASKIAGKETIPALCRNLSNLDAAKLRILENLQREDPHPMEEAEGYQLLMLQHGFSADQLADEVKKSKAYVYGRLKLCALAPEAREPFLNNEISASIALLIARIPAPKLQVQALNEVLRPSYGEPLSYRAAATHIQQRYMLDLRHAVFKIEDAKLLKSAGACASCPKRAGNQPEVFQGVDADVCTDPDCYAEKKAAHYAAVTVQANKKGIPVHEGSEGQEILSDSAGWRNGELVRADSSLWHFKRNAPGTRNNGEAEDYLDDQTMPAVVAYIKCSSGEMVALYKRVDVQRALEAVGACETEEAHAERMRQAETDPAKASAADEKHAEAQRKEAELEKKAADLTAFRVAVYTRIREHMAANGLTLQSLREITKLALEGDLGLPFELAHLYSFNVNNRIETAAHIDQASMPEVQLLLIDAVLGYTLGVTTWDIKNGNADEDDFGTVIDIAAHEGIDYNRLREEHFPMPIDAANLQAANLVTFIKSAPQRINELKDVVIADRPDLLCAFEDAANSLGFVYGPGGFQVPEEKAEDQHPAAQQPEQVMPTDEALAPQEEPSAAGEGTPEPAPAAAAAKAKRSSKKPTRTQEPA